MLNKKILILDRDGVINHDSPDYIKTPDEWIPIAGSLEAIAQASKAGYTIVLATNQSGLNRGLYDEAMLDRIHQKMCEAVEQLGGKITDIYFCRHTPNENCDCRKPKPGMLLAIQKDFQVKNTEMIFIGDSVKDFEAASQVGCRFILVKTGNGAASAKKLPDVLTFENLHSAVSALLLGEI